MKKMLMIAVALVASLNAVAVQASVSANDGWDLILADRNLIVSAPFAGTFGEKGIFNACATETEFKSLTKVKACTKYVFVAPVGDIDPMGHYDCVKTEERFTSMPRSGVRRACVKMGEGELYGKCYQYADVAYKLPTTQEIEVVYGSGESYPSTAFFKSFTIPACAQ